MSLIVRQVSCRLSLSVTHGTSDRKGMTTLVAVTAVLLTVFWLRMRMARSQFRRALQAMERGGTAQRAGRLFWTVVLFIAVIAVLRAYLGAHA